jgi:hypothetical protein
LNATGRSIGARGLWLRARSQKKEEEDGREA